MSKPNFKKKKFFKAYQIVVEPPIIIWSFFDLLVDVRE
jgi:hypothetical protein